MKKILVLFALCFTVVFAYSENIVFDLDKYKTGTDTVISFPIVQHNTQYNVSLENVEISTTKDPENITVEMKVTSTDPDEVFTVYRCDKNYQPEWLLPQGVNYWNWITVNDGILAFRDTYPTEYVHMNNENSEVVYKVNDMFVIIQNVWSNQGIITTLVDIVEDTLYNPIYINPQGMVSDKPWPGLNIVRDGNRIYKAIVKE